MKKIALALAVMMTAPLFAQEVRSYKISQGPKACPVELTVVRSEECLQLSLMSEDAQVEMSEYCQINGEIQKVQIVDEETGVTTTTFARQIEVSKAFLFTKNTTVQNARGLVVANHYKETSLKASEKTAILTLRDHKAELMQLPKVQTLACFYSTDAE